MSKNKSILVIGDLHFPYQHRDTFSFLEAIKKKYKPDRVISIGDEIDGHAWSFHTPESELDSPGVEFKRAKECMQRLHSLFKKMDILESNHGSLHIRKVKAHGIPEGFVKTYNDAWGVGVSWKWHYELTVKMSNGEDLYLHHARSANILAASQMMGMNCIFGHHHQKQSIQYWTSGFVTKFGAFTGCLVDADSLAQAYGKINVKKPLLGSIIILDGKPQIIRMNLNKNKRWDKKL